MRAQWALLKLTWLSLGLTAGVGCQCGESKDRIAPEFGGVSAVTAVDDNTLRLSWQGATDNVTLAEGIRYEIYQGLTATEIDLDEAVATTAPGATAFDMGSLAAGTTYYFVVRAKDAADNLDENTVVGSGATTFGGQKSARQAGTFSFSGDIQQALIEDDRLYLALGKAGIEVDALTDPAAPSKLGAVAVAESAEALWLDPVRQMLFVADGKSGLSVVNVATPDAPVLETTFDPGLSGATTTAVAATDQTAYLSAGTDLFVLDVIAPAAPDFLTRIPLASAALSMSIENEVLYILHEGGVISTWDVSEPGPKSLGSHTGPSDGRMLAVDARIAYVASPAEGVRMVSFEDPTAPVALGLAGSSASTLAVEGTTLVVGGNNTFFTFDVSDKSKPKQVTANPLLLTPDVVGIVKGVALYIYSGSPRARNGVTSSSGVALNIPPYAESTSPGARELVPANTAIAFFFSKPMDPASLTANTLMVSDSNGKVAGDTRLDRENLRLVFTPSAPLNAGTTYTVSLLSELKDTRGDFLWPSEGLTYSFTTAPPAPLPAAPGWLSAIPGDRFVRLSWEAVADAQGYVVYWANAAGVTTDSNRFLARDNAINHFGLTVGQPYYYRVAALSVVGEGALSTEVAATPVAPPRPQPVGSVWATPGNQKVTLSWRSVQGATRYNVYFSTTSNSPLSSMTKLPSGSRPYVHANLTNGTTYYYVVTAENAGGESLPSLEVQGTPYGPPLPGKVMDFWAQGQDSRNVLRWTWVDHASWYDVYASTEAGQARTLTPVGRAYGSNFTHLGLTNGQPYYYVVVARNDTGAGPDSDEVSAMPLAPPIPDAPSEITGQASNETATLFWGQVSYAARYNVYWSTVPGVTRANGQKVASVASPFAHAGLTNGQGYYYVVTAENASGESAESEEVAVSPMPPPLPSAPSSLTATAGNQYVELTWASVPGASYYTLYFSTSPNVDRATALKIYTGYRRYWHGSLSNGQTYYYVVTAVSNTGESLPSAEVSATPTAPPAPVSAPEVTGSPADGRNLLWWALISGATHYNVYFSTSPGVTTASQKIANAWPTWSHNGLLNGVTFYYRVAGQNAGGEGPLSMEISLTPQPPPAPGIPTQFSVVAGDRRNDLIWNHSSGATYYHLYWSNTEGVSKLNDKIRINYSRTFSHLGLTNGQKYCYAVAAGNNGGESELSQEICRTPRPPPAPELAPTLSASALNAAVRLEWTTVGNASLYYVYFKEGTGVTPQNGTRLGVGRSGPYNHFGLTNGTTYCYVATASNAGGEGPASTEVCATPVAPPLPLTPLEFAATPLNGQVRISFLPVQGAQQYNLYWGTSAGVTPENGTLVSGVFSGWLHTGRTNGTTYHYVLTAKNAAGESPPTLEVSATPFVPVPPAAPASLEAVAGNGQITLSWPLVNGATSYNLYFSTSSGIRAQTATKIASVSPGYVHTGRANGTTYYYVVTAVNENGESADSPSAQATPFLPPPAAPQAVSAIGGDGQVTLTWQAASGATSYNLYFGTSAGVTPQTGTKIASVSSGYVHTGRTNGTTYYYVVTAENAGGESAASVEVSAQPQVLMMVAPTWRNIHPGNAQVKLAWNPVPGATSYNLYFATGSTVSTATGTQIAGVTSPYVHTGRTNATTYAYVVTAVGGGQESVASTVRTATPVSIIAPSTFTVSGGYRKVNFTIGGTAGTVRAYNVYWSTTSGVTPRTGTRIASSSSSFAHLGAATGQTYYYVASYITDSGESAPSSEKTATPTGPTSPTLSATAKSGAVMLSMSLPEGAFRRTLYWSTSSPVSKQTANPISLTSTEYTHTGLTNGQTYYYLVSVDFPEGSRDSSEQSATPQENAASTPQLYTPTPDYKKVSLGWYAETAPSSWIVYFSTSPGVTASSSSMTAKGGFNGGQATHTGLLANQQYYYRVAGVYASGTGPLSNEVSVTTSLPNPEIETSIPGNQQVTLGWSFKAGATSYNLYWSTSSSLTTANGTKLSNVTSPYKHTGLSNGTTYYYILTAVYPEGESVGTSIRSAKPAIPAPSGVAVAGGPGSIKVTWSDAAGATSYNLYYSTSSTVTKSTGTKVSDARSGHVISGLTNGTRYYVVVTAVYGAVESADSTRANAVAQLAAPSYASANGGNSSVELYWGESTGATGYNVYWSTSPTVTTSTGTKVSVGLTTQWKHENLPNNVIYYYLVTATAGANESTATTLVAALTRFGTSVPSVSIKAADSTVQLKFSKAGNWAVYSSDQASVSPTTGTRTVAQGRIHTHPGLANGTPYYFVVTELGAQGDEGPPSMTVAAVPNKRAPEVSVGRVDETSVTLRIEKLPGATRYNVYAGTSPGVTRLTGTGILDVFVNTFESGALAEDFTFEHTGLTSGTAYYFVVTAVGPTGESLESSEKTARPRAGPTNFVATGAPGNPMQLLLSWDAVPGATEYRVYCSGERGAREENEVCATSSTPEASFTFTYMDLRYFQVTALDASGESAPSEEKLLGYVSSVPPTPALRTAGAGNGRAVLGWEQTSAQYESSGNRATSWDLYYGTTPGVTKANGTLLANVTAPYVHSGLTNGTPYYYVVVAKNSLGESDVSNEVSVTPAAVSSGQWTSVGGDVTRGEEVTSPALAVRGTTPFALYGQRDGRGRSRAQVKTYTGTSWQALGGVLNQDASTTSGWYHLAQDSSDLYAAYAETTGLARRPEVIVQRHDGTSWSRMGAPFTSRLALVLDLELISGVPHLLTSEQSATGEMQLFLRRWSGSTWSQLGSALNSPGSSVLEGTLGVTGSDPVVAFLEGALETDSVKTLRVLRSSGSSFIPLSVPASGFATMLQEVAVASSGQNVWLGVVGLVGTRPVLEVFQSTGGDFTQLGGVLNTTGGGVSSVSLAAVGSNVYASFSEDEARGYTNAMLRSWKGSAWQTEGNSVRYVGSTSVQDTSPLTEAGGNLWLFHTEGPSGVPEALGSFVRRFVP